MRLACAVLGLVVGMAVPAAAAHPPAARVTILYDAFGDPPGLEPDWGFAALFEYGGHRILFDAGNDGAVFARNVRALKVDLKHLDFAVISHRHGDHTGGLAYLLRVNPSVKIYARYERFGVFGGPVPATIAASLHDDWRVDQIAPGHCTGEPAFDALARAFGDRYVYAGLGTVVELN